MFKIITYIVWSIITRKLKYFLFKLFWMFNFYYIYWIFKWRWVCVNECKHDAHRYINYILIKYIEFIEHPTQQNNHCLLVVTICVSWSKWMRVTINKFAIPSWHCYEHWEPATNIEKNSLIFVSQSCKLSFFFSETNTWSNVHTIQIYVSSTRYVVKLSKSR